VHRVALLLVVALGGCELLEDVACVTGDTGSCPPPPVDLVDLSGDGVVQECDFLASFPVAAMECSNGQTATSGGVDEASCISQLGSIQPTCMATTADLETCAMSHADDPCDSAATDECRALAACGL
jgi:hypothetical protein